MAFILGGTTIRAPKAMTEDNSTQYAQHRTLAGSVNRDHFGQNKRVWLLEYENLTKSEFDTINTVYQSYLSSGTTKTFQVTEANYTIASTNVHIDLPTRSFTVAGESYLSDFTVTLHEA